MEVEAIKYTGFRNLTRQLKGLPPGPEGSMMKLCATELGLRIAMFAMELLGPYSQFEHGAAFAIDQGTWAHRMLAARARRSPPGRTRSSTTSSASACWACPRDS